MDKPDLTKSKVHYMIIHIQGQGCPDGLPSGLFLCKMMCKAKKVLPAFL